MGFFDLFNRTSTSTSTSPKSNETDIEKQNNDDKTTEPSKNEKSWLPWLGGKRRRRTRRHQNKRKKTRRRRR